MRRLLPLLPIALAALLLLPVAPAGADDVAAAARSVAALREETRRTADELAAGTRHLERARAELSQVRRDAAAARGAARAAQEAEREARQRLSAVVAAAYRSPVPDDVVLALTTGPDGLRDALAARADLDKVRGSEHVLLERAEQSRARAAELAAAADRLEAEARERAVDVEERVARLRRAATQAQRRLQTADAQLRRAREAQAACTGRSSGGHANGFLPDSALCPIGGGHRLRADAAAAFLRMSAERRLCVTDSYRSYAGQVSVYRRTPALAAVPGTSKHGLGIALDLGCGAERFDSETYAWLKANAPRFGWVHPAWAEPGGSMPEPWHWEYVG